jgi:hypothetical protein
MMRVVEQALGLVAGLQRGAGPQAFQRRLQPGRVAPAALEGQQVLGHGPALVLLAQSIGDRRAGLVEEHLVDLVLSGQGDDRLHADPRGLSMSISRKVIPAWGRPSAEVRARQNIRLAQWAWVVQIFEPVST